MKIGIYNRWLHTLGGGEKHSLAIASFLSKKNEVEVISHKEILKSDAEERLNLDLSKVKFIFIPDLPVKFLPDITSSYDLFINSSFMDFFPSYSKKSLNLIFFPAKIGDLSFNKAKHRIGRVVKNIFSAPYIKQGVREIRFKDGFFNYLVDDNFFIELPVIKKPIRLQISFSIKCITDSIAYLLLNGIEISKQNYEKNNSFEFNIELMPVDKRQILTIQFRSMNGERIPTDITINRYMLFTPNYKLFVNLFEKRCKRIGLRLLQLPFTPSNILNAIDSYDITIANSKFTKYWIKKYWNVDSELLYPLIDVEKFSSGNKNKRIISIGRFFAGGHNKKHDVMISVFKEMVDENLTDWELILIGGSTPGEEHNQYLHSLKLESENYPIKFLVDTPFATLVDYLQSSSIYWHASGYGEDVNENPVRFEHFGITTVEAMASGAVPVVINKGGQPEIIKHGQNGFLWDNIADLKKFTYLLANDSQLLQKISMQAVEDSRNYSTEAFEHSLQKILTKIGL